jgi:hypothetical protein
LQRSQSSLALGTAPLNGNIVGRLIGLDKEFFLNLEGSFHVGRHHR